MKQTFTFHINKGGGFYDEQVVNEHKSANGTSSAYTSLGFRLVRKVDVLEMISDEVGYGLR